MGARHLAPKWIHVNTVFFFCLLVLPYSDVSVFVLFYFILLLYFRSLFSNEIEWGMNLDGRDYGEVLGGVEGAEAVIRVLKNKNEKSSLDDIDFNYWGQEFLTKTVGFIFSV